MKTMVLCCADDKAETDHLHALAAAAGGEGRRLRVFPGDLLDGAALLAAARGCSGVFHLASPCIVDRVLDPQVHRPATLLLSTSVPASSASASAGSRLTASGRVPVVCRRS